MKLKLAALLSLAVLGLAGCSSDYKTANTNTTPATTATPQTIAQNNPNIIEANANPTDSTGGTKEGCKCSAVGMTCNHKEGEKGCCGGKDGTCSTEKNGVSDCCAGGKEGAACCSVAKMKATGTDHKNMDMSAPEKKSAPPPPSKS
jgi:hypothetical protein